MPKFTRSIFSISVLLSSVAFSQTLSDVRAHGTAMVEAMNKYDFKTACNHGKVVSKYFKKNPPQTQEQVVAVKDLLEAVYHSCSLVKQQADLNIQMNQYYKENHCAEYNAAKQRCVTAPNIKQCIEAVLPGIGQFNTSMC